MEISLQKTQEAKKLKCTTNEMIMADLLSIGYSNEDAYAIAFPGDSVLNKDIIKGNINDLINKVKFKQLCDIRREKNAGFLSVSNEAEDLELISPEDVAKEVLLAAKKQPIGSKERADLMAKYNDIRNENKKDIKDPNNDPVQFFFPIACEKCPLLEKYNQFLKNKNKGKPQSEWETEVRPDEMQRIIESAERHIIIRR